MISQTVEKVLKWAWWDKISIQATYFEGGRRTFNQWSLRNWEIQMDLRSNQRQRTFLHPSNMYMKQTETLTSGENMFQSVQNACSEFKFHEHCNQPPYNYTDLKRNSIEQATRAVCKVFSLILYFFFSSFCFKNCGDKCSKRLIIWCIFCVAFFVRKVVFVCPGDVWLWLIVLFFIRYYSS